MEASFTYTLHLKLTYLQYIQAGYRTLCNTAIVIGL